jgi:hypothetical protein
MSARCIGEPISWLRLERYHLGEGDAAERASVAEHLAACGACAACLARIEADGAVAVPPLAAPERAQPAPSARGRRVALLTGGLALAAAVALLVASRPKPRDGDVPGDVPPTGSRVKGDGVAFALVRDDSERIVEAGGAFHDGDRFKALVTCPPAMTASFDLVVYDATGAAFPLAPAAGVACGNDVALPGAFRLTGSSDETVCLAWSTDGGVDRNALSLGEPPPGSSALCKRLVAEGAQ